METRDSYRNQGQWLIKKLFVLRFRIGWHGMGEVYRADHGAVELFSNMDQTT
ncbi:hypothetical protein MYX75_00815 [Acidobacteria bacterium AH-259-A15]|nr:hypothetical protein [Acidobacteria bacterium AH-259-A15]